MGLEQDGSTGPDSERVPRPSVLAADVVGRGRERRFLDERIRAAEQGHGGVTFLLGEAGIGKTRLTRLVGDAATALGFHVLHGRAVPTATPVAYRPLAESLTAAARRGIVPDDRGLAPFRSGLARLVPDWRAGDVALDDSVLVLAEGVLRFLGAVAGGIGCLLVLEDLHWADPETLAIVEYLADHLASERVLCVVTARDERESAAVELARALQARRAADVVHLDRLDDDSVAAMVASCLGAGGAAPEVIALAARADGVPFLVEELLAVAVSSDALVRDGDRWQLSGTVTPVVPLTFADSVRRRLHALTPNERTVIGAAAILGRRFDWSLLSSIAGLDDEKVTFALRAGTDAQLFAVDDTGDLEFRHALTRDTVLADLLPPERARLCERALRAVERAHPGLPGAWCALAAEIAAGAGERGEAAKLCLEDGRRSLVAGALGTAEATLERGRLLVPASDATGLEIEEILLQVLALAGKHDHAEVVGESLLPRLRDALDAAVRGTEARVWLARAAVTATRWAAADAHLEAATSMARDVGDRALRARLDVVTAQVAILRQPDRAVALAQDALAVATQLDLPDVVVEALEIVGRYERSRDLDAAEAAFARAASTAAAAGRRVWEARARHELGTVDLLRHGGIARLEEARGLAVGVGALASTVVIDVQIGAVLCMRDDPTAGIEVCRRAATVARRYRLDEALVAARAFEAAAHARAGRRDEAERGISEAIARGGDTPEARFNVGFARAHVALADEDRDAAIAALEHATAPAQEAVGVQTTGPNAAILALLLAVRGDDAATEWLASPMVHFLARGYAAYARAVIAGRGGDGAEAAALVALGDADLREFGWYRELGHRLVAEGAIADSWGNPETWLRDALAWFDATGTPRIASACRALMRTAGISVPRRRSAPATRSALEELGITAREEEVLELLALGLSNRDVGGRLHLSARTVERHVANLTVKAGLSRRAEVVAFAARSVAERPPPPPA